MVNPASMVPIVFHSPEEFDLSYLHWVFFFVVESSFFVKEEEKFSFTREGK